MVRNKIVVIKDCNATKVESFCRQLTNMLTNHPDRNEREVILNLKIGEIKITKKIVGFFKENCDVCKKLEEKIQKLKTLDEFLFIRPEVEENNGSYFANIEF